MGRTEQAIDQARSQGKHSETMLESKDTVCDRDGETETSNPRTRKARPEQGQSDKSKAGGATKKKRQARPEREK